MQEQAPTTADALKACRPEDAALPEAELELLRFVKLLTEALASTADEDVERLRRSGWTDPEIAEAVYIISLFAFFNRVADAFGLADPNYAEMFKAETARQKK